MEIHEADYAKAWEWRFQREAAQQEQVRVAAGEAVVRLLPQAVQVLVERTGATEVWLFGSLSDGTWRPGSDVNLAVSGATELSYLQLFNLTDELEALFRRPVHLVLLEDERSQVAAGIRERGIKLPSASEIINTAGNLERL